MTTPTFRNGARPFRAGAARRIAFAVLAALALTAYGSGDHRAQQHPQALAIAALQAAWGSSEPSLVYTGNARDALEFFRAAPGGNGRSCATCHRPEDHFALTPATVQARWQLLHERRKHDPAADDPLFRSIDADDFAQDFTTLRTKALVRVTLPLPANVKRADDAQATTAWVWRAVPTVINVDFTAPFQSDGREATLESQAVAAMRAHAEVEGDPPAQMVESIAAFQRGLFSSQRVRRIANALRDGREPPSPDGPLTPKLAHGRKVFEEFCATCHGGATQTVNGEARFLSVPARGPKTEGAQDFVNVFVATPRPPPPGLPPPAVTPRFFDGIPTAGLADKPFAVTLPTGAVSTFVISDPGRGLITGDAREFGRFDVPTLFGIALTAPYFHDNAAADLDAVIEHYQAMFRFLEFLDVEGGFFAPEVNGQGCEPGTCAFRAIPDGDVSALKAYLMQLGR